VVARAGGHDEVIEREVFGGRLVAAANLQRVAVEIDRCHLGQHDLNVAGVAQDAADRLRDIAGGQHRAGDLVEQRLKDVVIASIDHRHANGSVGQRLAAASPPKPPPTITTCGHPSVARAPGAEMLTSGSRCRVRGRRR